MGGGDLLTQRILSGHHIILSVVIGYLAVRFIAGPLSYSAAVPGGIFAPLLAVGALWGLLFVGGFDAVWPGDTTQLAVPMALVGMAAFFGATVRAPVTGLVLVDGDDGHDRGARADDGRDRCGGARRVRRGIAADL